MLKISTMEVPLHQIKVLKIQTNRKKYVHNQEKIDLIIGANATKEVLLPCSASLIQKQLGLENGKTACFDVGSSCLSFFTALEIAEMFLKTGKYKNILIVSSEIASIGINYSHIESAGLFGDGAAAFIIGNNDKNLISKFLYQYSLYQKKRGNIFLDLSY